MARPLIAVVGRPNVGKSTLFNKIVGKRLSIVEDTPGVTRDRIYAEGEWRSKTFHIVDTGGIEPKTDDVILSQMRRQAQLAIDSADVIVFVVDIRTGITATDQDVASMLQRSGKPVVLCRQSCMNFIIWALVTRIRYLRCMGTVWQTCWMPAMNIWILTKRMNTVMKILR